MGSSTRRKELRRAKFAHLQHKPQASERVTAQAVVPSTVVLLETSRGHTSNEEAGVTEPTGAQAVDTTANVTIPSPTRPRFVCFIGNLPFSTTAEALVHHFRKINPSSIRHGTSKETGKSRGFAFVEFEGYDHMKTCLKLYHHSVFDDGISPARKINVELTAGGGGAKSQSRKAKIRFKNDKLDEERRRRALVTTTTTPSHPDTAPMVAAGGTDSDIHPSRRGRITT